MKSAENQTRTSICHGEQMRQKKRPHDPIEHSPRPGGCKKGGKEMEEVRSVAQINRVQSEEVMNSDLA